MAMFRALTASLCCVVLAASALRAQRPREIAVHTCALADSMLGPVTVPGHIEWNRFPAGDSARLVGGSEHLSATIIRNGSAPAPYPTPELTFLVGGRQGQILLARRPLHPRVAMSFDDSVSVSVGPGLVGSYTGPEALTLAPVTVLTTPAIALRLAKAARLAVTVDAATLVYGSIALNPYRLLYRFAICDSLPPER